VVHVPFRNVIVQLLSLILLAAAPPAATSTIIETAAHGNNDGTTTSTDKDGGVVNHQDDITSLQIRTGDGQSSVVLKLRYYDTIGDLMKVLEKSRADLEGVSYELRTRYPNRAYHNKKETLFDAGLTPNGTILIKKIPAACRKRP